MSIDSVLEFDLLGCSGFFMKPDETCCLLRQEQQSCEQTGLPLTLPLIPKQGCIGEISLGLCCSK